MPGKTDRCTHFMNHTGFLHATALHLRGTLALTDGGEGVCSTHRYRGDDKSVRTVEETQDPAMVGDLIINQDPDKKYPYFR